MIRRYLFSILLLFSFAFFPTPFWLLWLFKIILRLRFLLFFRLMSQRVINLENLRFNFLTRECYLTLIDKVGYGVILIPFCSTRFFITLRCFHFLLNDILLLNLFFVFCWWQLHFHRKHEGCTHVLAFGEYIDLPLVIIHDALTDCQAHAHSLTIQIFRVLQLFEKSE